MDRRSFIKTALLTGASSLSAGLPSISCGQGARPNILFVMSDDHASRAIGCYDDALIETPQIDRIAGQGKRFDLCFCSNAICAPSRAVILTGKHSHRNGLIDNSVAFEANQVTFPRILQQHGYQTAVVGKWHLKSQPSGFDYWNILPGQGHYYNPDFNEMGSKKQVDGYVTDLITDSALSWLEKRDRSKPFCLLLHHKAPHRNWMPALRHLHLYSDKDIPLPHSFFDDYLNRSSALRDQECSIAEDLLMDYDLKAPKGTSGNNEVEGAVYARKAWEREFGRMNASQRRIWQAAYKDKNDTFYGAGLKGKDLLLWKYQRYIKDYLRCIAAVDEGVGRTLDFLNRNRLDQNTIVIYTSDQGFFLGEHGLFDKRFMYEESMKMPLLISYPKEIKAGVDKEHLVQNLDFAPTLLDFAGIEAPEGMQGLSMRGILKNRSPVRWRDAVYYHYYEYPAVHMVKRHYGIRTLRYKLIHFYHDIDAWELYDLHKDPYELNNIIGDPSYAGVRLQLQQKLKELRDRYQDTDSQKYMPKPAIQTRHKAVGCPVTLKHPYAVKYSGGGPNALTDGWLAPQQLNGFGDHKVWQGFEQVDLDAVIDLKRNRSIHSIGAGFLQQISAWIFLPASVTFYISSDGKKFRELSQVKNPFPIMKPEAFRHEFTWQGNSELGRFVRIAAKNIGVCPRRHAGAGSKAWIFADEITIR